MVFLVVLNHLRIKLNLEDLVLVYVSQRAYPLVFPLTNLLKKLHKISVVLASQSFVASFKKPSFRKLICVGLQVKVILTPFQLKVFGVLFILLKKLSRSMRQKILRDFLVAFPSEPKPSFIKVEILNFAQRRNGVNSPVLNQVHSRLKTGQVFEAVFNFLQGFVR